MAPEAARASERDPRRDQAAGLRRLLARDRLRVLPIASGSAGVGRTTAVIGLARAAGAIGMRAVILDQSAGDVPAALALDWRWELAHLLKGEREWRDVALAGPDGIGVVPAAQGLAALAEAGGSGEALFGGFARLRTPPELVLVNVTGACGSASALVPEDCEVLLVTRTTPAAVTATYARLKDQWQRHGRRKFRLLVNRAAEGEARALHQTMARAARRFLGAELAYAGSVPAGALPGATAWTAIAHTLPRWALAEYGDGPSAAPEPPAH